MLDLISQLTTNEIKELRILIKKRYAVESIERKTLVSLLQHQRRENQLLNLWHDREILEFLGGGE